MEKRARYINGNNQLMQEFSYASCMTKIFINRVYNSHQYGSVLWDLFGKQANMVYNTWSVSVRNMLRIDRESHRYLIEPLSEMNHLKEKILKDFVSFTEKLSNSPKNVIKKVFNFVQSDCTSVTGSNNRNIRLNCASDYRCYASKSDIEKTDFFPVPSDSEWKIPLIKELIEMRDDIKDTANWNKDEIIATLQYLCTS